MVAIDTSSGDMILVCHVILQGHLIKVSCYGQEPIRVSCHPAKYNVFSLLKGSRDFIDGSPSC